MVPRGVTTPPPNTGSPDQNSGSGRPRRGSPCCCTAQPTSGAVSLQRLLDRMRIHESEALFELLDVNVKQYRGARTRSQNRASAATENPSAWQ